MFDIAIKPQNKDGEIVVLIHGLFHCSAMMYPLGRFLNKHGFRVFCYDYRTTRHNVVEHAEKFKTYLEHLVVCNPKQRINIVTHSLGSLVTRQALAHLADENQLGNEILDRQHIGRLVFTAPPNRGSKVAATALKLAPFSGTLIKPLADLSYGEKSRVHQIPIPAGVELGIIAAAYDHLVPQDSTQLPEVQTAFTVMPAIHMTIMNNRGVRNEILHFLRHGKFSS
ncbi:MAG: alpha/beta fold hydrolase [Victivallaceae bacterium]|nr:alpha/beta fold hydrolase [Victivallaceae bacterium]NLK83442.1 alpha/beta hydrolase [Lentisphaerota bacterium]